MCKSLVPALIALLLIPLAGQAIPTGLNMMPTAEVLSTGEIRADSEFGHSGKLFVPLGECVTGAQYGLILGLEAGLDNVTDVGVVGNVKWRFKGEGLVMPALAVGVQNIAAGETPQYYAVATKSLLPSKMVQVSAGVLRASDATVTMVGAGAGFGPFRVQVDHTNGSTSFDRTAYGVTLSLGEIRFTGTQYEIEGAPMERTLMVSYLYRIF